MLKTTFTKKAATRLAVLFIFLTALTGQAQQRIDTILQVNGYNMHFSIVRGKGTPIVFEAGAGNDGSVWNELLKPLETITGAPLVTYDRVGLGKSSADNSRRSIADGTKLLEAGLRQLHFTGSIMLVAHSRGALYATTFANDHPEEVKMAVLIDGSNACSCQLDLTTVKYQDTALKTLSFPHAVPVVSLISDYTPFASQPGKAEWTDCQQKFVAEAPNRMGITAYGCGHYIFKDNPLLAIHVIAEAYSRIVDKNYSAGIARRALLYAAEGANQLKKKETDYQHSEDDLNDWGYALTGEGKMQEALTVFKLNADLHPSSWNAYDSYGEALLKNGQKEEAIKMYQKSVQLNPNNEGGKEILKKIAN